MIPHSRPWITNDDIHSVSEFLENGLISDGHKIEELRALLCKKGGVNNFYFQSCGKQALRAILRSLSLKQSDEIILPTYVCKAVLEAVQEAGYTPVLCDVGPHWVVSPQSVADKMSKRTKVVIIPQIFGIHVGIEQFRSLGIVIINDLCQNFDYFFYKNGDLGDFAFFSFSATKCLTAGGGGGFCVSNKSLRVGGQLRDDGFSDIQAALLIVQLKRYEQFTERRREISESYFDAAPDEMTENLKKIETCFYRFPILHKGYGFEKISDFFYKNKVVVRHGVDQLLHRDLSLNDDLFPNSVNLFEKTISLPVYPALENAELEQVSVTLKNFLFGQP
jgi:perosamine synthetase